MRSPSRRRTLRARRAAGASSLRAPRILWNDLAAWRCFGDGCGSLFDRLGLVADGYGPGETEADVGKRRLVFHSFALLSRRVDGTVAELLGEVPAGDGAHVFAWRDRASGQRHLVAWADRTGPVELDFEAARTEVTGLITDESGIPVRHEVVATSGGKLRLSLDPDPVVIEPE